MGDISIEGVYSVVTWEQSSLRAYRVCEDQTECILAISGGGESTSAAITGFMRKQ